jgi:DNA repair exonuclease SbcCD ATPase subunit
MRIVKIEFKNIAPLAGEHVIQLHHAISQRAFLYAVTGKTEAERSAVINALCTALYGKTNELKGGDILYHNAKEAYSKVTFVLKDKAEYQVLWTIQRRSNRDDINWVLKQISPKQVQWQGEKELQQSIELLLKLNLKQFLSSKLSYHGVS